jgi:HPt (histidine-containing phosphotransfer) domain-containing protein
MNTAFKFPDEQVDIKAEEDEAPEIEVVDDTPPEDQNRTPAEEPPKEFSDDELEQYDKSVKKRIRHFTKSYHDERRAKEQALREKEEALRLTQSIVEENKKLKGSLSQGQVALLEQAKKVVENELNNAKQKYKTAYETGDSDALAEAQSELTAVTIKARELHNFKPAPLQEPQNQVQTQPTQPPQLDRKTEAWKNQNSWFGSDRRMTSYALAIHDELTQEERISPSSDEYFRRLDSEMRARFPEAFEADQEVEASPPPRRSNVAPATRSTAPKKIVLSQSQANIAKRLGIPLEAYAKQVALERKKGI